VHYQDPKAALAWLVDAFGFEITMAIDGPPESPEMCHYEMDLNGKSRVMVGGQWTSAIRSPVALDGATPRPSMFNSPTALMPTVPTPAQPGRPSPRSPKSSFTGTGSCRPSLGAAFPLGKGRLSVTS
jgi:hypothetical protein